MTNDERRATRKYVANVPHVREVSLLGTGPDGGSRLLIAADMRFFGVPFGEVSLSILTGENEAQLVQAWNSVRFFAWCERTFFSTPYAHGNVRVTTEPTSFAVAGILRVADIASRRSSAKTNGAAPSISPTAASSTRASPA